MKGSRDQHPPALPTESAALSRSDGPVTPVEEFVRSVLIERLTSWMEPDGLDWVDIDELTFEDAADL